MRLAALALALPLLLLAAVPTLRHRTAALLTDVPAELYLRAAAFTPPELFCDEQATTARLLATARESRADFDATLQRLLPRLPPAQAALTRSIANRVRGLDPTTAARLELAGCLATLKP